MIIVQEIMRYYIFKKFVFWISLINRDLATLKAAFNQAVAWHILGKNPIKDAFVHIDDILVGKTNQHGQIGIGGIRNNANIKIKKKGYLPAQKQIKS